MRIVTLNLGNVTTLATSTQTQVPTPDDQYPRLIRRIWVTPTTALVQVNLIRTGFTVAVIDCARFAAGNWPVEINEWWGRTLPIFVSVYNGTGSTVVPQIVIAYEAPDNPNDATNRPPA